MRRALGVGWRRHVPMLTMLALGCSSGSAVHDRSPSCPSRVEEPLVGATVTESYLGLSPSQARAVVDLVDGSGATDAECSGIAVAPGWVLGAAHCTQIPAPAVRVLDSSGGKSQLVAIARTELHPTLDIALFELDFSSIPAASSLLDLRVTPVPAPNHDLGLVIGDTLELAGFGITESGSSGELRFLVERLVEIDATSLHVDGYGMTGACEGDSGGPLFTRTSDGSLWVAGVLTAGAPSCVDQDRYLRLDTLGGWVQATTGDYVPSQQDCGSVSAEGRCLAGAALWCEDGVLETDDCASQGAVCGWDVSRAGFRCVARGASACVGVDAVGTCQGTSAVTCVDGTLVTTACGACGACRPTGATGAPYCVSGD